MWGCSSAGRAPALQAGGHGFDSHHLHHFFKNTEQSSEILKNREVWSEQSCGRNEVSVTISTKCLLRVQIPIISTT